MLINGTHPAMRTNLPTNGTGAPTGSAPTTGTGSSGNTGSTGSTGSSGTAATGATLGGTDFLTLMLAQ
jgi:hypothetical protein